MPAKTSDSDANNIIEKYRAGVPGKDIADQFGISTTAVYGILKRSGVELTGRIGKMLPAAEILAAYNAGSAQRDIAIKCGVSDNVITSILRNNGITKVRPRIETAIMRDLATAGATDSDVVRLFQSGIGIRGVYEKLGISLRSVAEILRRNGIETRDRSAQQFARMARTTADERTALTKAAHDAVRGTVRPIEASIAMAATFEAKGDRRRSNYETILAEMLAERGISATPQKAFGPYNSDLAAAPVAVEVLGGKWHWYGQHLARSEKRTKFILNSGWHVLMVAVTDAFPLTPAVADYIAAYINEARGNPSAAREYRVIWGAGEFTTSGGADDDNFSIKPPFTNARDRATGQYKRIPR